jgi:hypothetical protein
MTRSENLRFCRPLIVAVISCAVLGTSAGVIAQTFEFPDFSAEVITHLGGGRSAADGESTGRFYTSKGRVRTETYRNGVLTSAMIVDARNRTAWQLSPERKAAMDMSANYAAAQRQANAMVQTPLDPKNPCAALPGATCRKVGIDTVAGRSTEKWELTEKDGTRMVMWIDPALHFALRVQASQFEAEFRNVKLAPQPDALFQIPADYQRLGAGGRRQ